MKNIFTSSLRSLALLIHINFFVYCFLEVDFAYSQVIKYETKPIISISTGYEHTCAVFDDMKMKCWGWKYAWGLSDDFSEGLGDSISEFGDFIPYIDVGTGIGVLQVKCGYSYTCMRLDTGNIKCIGRNDYGQIGLGVSTAQIGAPTGYTGNDLPNINIGTGLQVLDLAVGSSHSCVKVTGNKVKCFGMGAFGCLGYGDNSIRGDSSSDMGNNLPFVDLGTGVEVASVHSGTMAPHNCVILSVPFASAQRIKCWGFNSNYQLGYGDTNNRGDSLYEMGDNLTLVDLGTESKVKQIALGYVHTCALLINDVLKCWGAGLAGKLGSGSHNDISSTGTSMPSVSIDSGKTVKLLAAGGYHTCIIYTDMSTMKCYGFNYAGQLGQGDTDNRGESPTSMIPSIPAIQLGTGSLNISSIHCGRAFTCVVFDDNSIKCFGDNTHGQLISGSIDKIGDGPGEMGSNLPYLMLFGTFSPTRSPTKSPTLPTKSPTKSPTPPTLSPTKAPTLIPTIQPSNSPTPMPTLQPTLIPTSLPTNEPTHQPTNQPTNAPSSVPTDTPTNSPTQSPTITPTTSSPTILSAAANNNNNNSAVSIGVGISVPLILCLTGAWIYVYKYKINKSSTKTATATTNEQTNLVATP